MNKRLLTVAAFALAGCVTVVAQDKKKEFKMPTGYAGITFLLVYGKNAIMYIPFGRTAFYALPSGKILAVKQNDSVGRSRETSTF